MTESKHKHARAKDERPVDVPRTRSEGSRSDGARRRAEARTPWTRTTWGRLAIAAVLAGGVVLFRVLTDGTAGDADPTDELSGASSASALDATEWVAQDGSAYRMTVKPSLILVNAGSSSGCITIPSPDRTNLRFTVEVENVSPTAAAVPSLEFAANMTAAGVVDPDLTSFAKASKRIELLPLTARTCADAARIGPAGRELIAPGSTVVFTGTLGGVATPVDDQLALIVRYVRADADGESGSAKALVTVPFAAR